MASASLSDYLAAERTLLAWIRTGLALMGLGFVLARFGLFLRVLEGNTPTPVTTHSTSFWFGIALLVLGAFINLASGWSHFRLIRELDRGTAGLQRSAFLGVGLAAILAVIGLSMAIYVASVRGPQTSLKPANPASTQ
jgi:putative membrane protein